MRTGQSLALEFASLAEKRRIQVIVNPISGRPGGRTVLEGLCGRMQSAGHDVHVYHTQAPGDARNAAERSVSEGADLIVISGGDGTISQVVDGIEQADIPILVVPSGTANILGKYLGTRLDEEWLWQVFEAGRDVEFDVLQQNGTRFLMVAGAGFDAEAVRRLTQRRRGHISYLSYVSPIWETFWHYRHPNLTVEADGDLVYEGPGLALVGNLPRYATSLHVFDRALPNDGLLDLCVFRCQRKSSLLYHALNVLLKRHEGTSGVTYQQARHIHIRSDGRVPVQLDGDVAGWLPAEFKLAPEKVRFLVSETWKMAGVVD